MQDAVETQNPIVSKSISGGGAMPRKRSYEADAFEAFKVESVKKAAKVEDDHIASINYLQLQLQIINAQHQKMVEKMKNDDSAYIMRLQSVNDRTFVAQKDHLNIQQDVIKTQADNLNDMESIVKLLEKKNLSLEIKLASAVTKNATYAAEKNSVGVELNNLRYILEVGEDPVRGPAFCPISRTSLLRNDTVAVFQGGCNCNSMVKHSVSGPCFTNFNNGSDVRCLNCFAACDRLVTSTVASATADNTWRKLEKLTGCGDFESVSSRNSAILEQRLKDQKAIDTKNLRNSIMHLMSSNSGEINRV